MKKTIIFLLVALILLVVIVYGGGGDYMDYMTIGQGDIRWCLRYGVCTLDTLIVYNISVIGQVFNVTMNLVTWNITENFNVGGNLVAKNITADNFIGDGSLITGIVASNVEDIWVNESGDTMTGGLILPNITADDGTLEIDSNVNMSGYNLTLDFIKTQDSIGVTGHKINATYNSTTNVMSVTFIIEPVEV